MPDPTDVMTILDPITPELHRALAAVLAVGFGQVTLHVEHGEVQRIVYSCSLKKRDCDSPASAPIDAPEGHL